MLKKQWYSDSMATTIRNVIEAADPVYLKDASERDFEKGLLDELKFIGVFPKDFFPKAENYVRKHIHELYRYAKKVAKASLEETATAE